VKATSQRSHNPVDDNTLVSLTQDTYPPYPPWTRLGTCCQVPPRLKHTDLSVGHGQMAPAYAIQSHCGNSVPARSLRRIRLRNTHRVNTTTLLNGAHIIPSLRLSIPSPLEQWTPNPTSTHQAQHNPLTTPRQPTLHRHTICPPRTLRLSMEERSARPTWPLPKPSHRTTPPTQSPLRTISNPAK
jgi:hypothetical protein